MSTGTSLEGRVVVITGATRGIGRGVADALAMEGAALAVCGRTRGDAARLARELRATYAVVAIGADVDVSRRAEVEEFAAQVQNELGSADALINNAAVLGPVGPIHLVDLGEWEQTLSVNVVGVANSIAVFWNQLAASPPARIVNLSGGGIGGPSPMKRTSAYVASKAAVVALTENLADDAAAIGATVNAIAPGAIATGFMDGVLVAGEALAGEALFKDAVTRVVGPEPATLSPVVAVLRFLLSPESGAINGRTLSARWETPERLRLDIEGGIDESRYRLRRIDGQLYGPLS